MPQARSGGSKRTATKRTATKRTATKRTATATKRTGTATKRAGTATKRAGTATRAGSARPKPGSPEARLEAAANRVRKVNEQIIDAGRHAGESTLTSYEKFLKSIASSLERGPGKSDVEWISNLATAQAKFIRDVTSSVTKAARKRLK
jgi:hypothetical protein